MSAERMPAEMTTMMGLSGAEPALVIVFLVVGGLAMLAVSFWFQARDARRRAEGWERLAVNTQEQWTREMTRGSVPADHLRTADAQRQDIEMLMKLANDPRRGSVGRF